MNLGMPELIVIGAVALLLFGAKRLPELARSLGGSVRAFKDGLKDGFSEPEDKPKS
ncbi:MAG: twin-arginine translocase TatA/TatE family subunit [Elusimicrobia bacterium]|nr:twin-arginine translocase TatA/TatE family subunit [Elusimicrobiota bacterium]